MNIYDVSKKAGVSIATVSRVLNGNSNVTEATRQKVRNAIAELNYIPNVFARGLGLNTMKTIGIMCADSSDIYLANAVYFLEQELRKNGYDAILCCTGYDYAAKKDYLDLLLSKRVDGVILVGSHFVSETEDGENRYIIEAAAKLPVFLLNGFLEGDNIYSVLCNDREAVYNATALLVQSGCRRIVYLYSSNSYSGMKKLTGFRDACKDFADRIDSASNIFCTKDIMQAKKTLSALYQKTPFDGVLASEDTLAVGAVKFAYENNIAVPSCLQIIGYNNSVLAVCTEPELTSVDNRIQQLSADAVRLLMQVLSGETVPSKNVFAAEIIKRNTTKF